MERIFPFWKIPSGAQVCLYGAGQIGIDYYNTCRAFDWCTILAWVDKTVTSACGEMVTTPESGNWIKIFDNADIILIAIHNQETIKEVCEILTKEYAVDLRKVVIGDTDENLSSFLGWYYEHFLEMKPSANLDCIFHDISFGEVLNFLRTAGKYCVNLKKDGIHGLEVYGSECHRKNKFIIFNDKYKRIGYWPGESYLPDFTVLDYAFSERNYIENNYNCRSYYPKEETIQDRSIFSDRELLSRKFCNFVYYNQTYGDGSIVRKYFCKMLARYKKVDCPGRVMNNMENAIIPRFGNWKKGKSDFLKNYKFTIAFENRSISGYTTEKLFQPLSVGSIPIYWGNPDVCKYINKECLINCNEYDNDFDAVVKRVIEIDSDPELYLHMVKTPPMNGNYRWDTESKKMEFLDRIVTDLFN